MPFLQFAIQAWGGYRWGSGSADALVGSNHYRGLCKLPIIADGRHVGVSVGISDRFF